MAGAAAFSFFSFISIALGLPHFVGSVSRILVKEETISSLAVIAAGNVMGLLVDLMLILPAPWFAKLQIEAAHLITFECVESSLLANMTLGIIGGGILEVGQAAYRRTKHPFALLFPTAILILSRAQHNMMDLFAFMITKEWHPFIWFAILVGNIIGALTLSVVNFDDFGHFTEHQNQGKV